LRVCSVSRPSAGVVRQRTGLGKVNQAVTSNIFNTTVIKLNSVALVCERTIPTERPPIVGEVSAKFCG
jgi:hypothetical protein